MPLTCTQRASVQLLDCGTRGFIILSALSNCGSNALIIPAKTTSMVSLLLLNPTHKFRFLSKLILKSSRRLIKNIESSTTSTSALCSPLPAEEWIDVKKLTKDVRSFIKSEHIYSSEEGLTLDKDFYKNDSEGGLCVFRVERTLFKVHKCYLIREPSAFGDMFSLPIIGHLPDTSPIPLFDTVDEFRDLLWAIYATPTQLISTTENPSITRLLNVAKMANKYCIASYEDWALQRILTLCQDHTGFLRTAPPETCAHALKVALLCDHHELLNVMTYRLVARILWTDMDPTPILNVAEAYGLRRLQGVIYYKELVALEQNTKGALSDDSANWSMDADRRLRFLAAHDSLVALWDRVRVTPSTFEHSGCTSHGECLEAWTEMWLNASSANQMLRYGEADVLGRLKAMMILLKKWTVASPMMFDCRLAALESITILRDDIVSGLVDHFQKS